MAISISLMINESHWGSQKGEPMDAIGPGACVGPLGTQIPVCVANGVPYFDFQNEREQEPRET
jgi:hypothetical protein